MSLIRDSLKKVQEQGVEKEFSSTEPSGESASPAALKRKAPTLLLLLVGVGVLGLAGFLFFTGPGGKQKVPSPKLDSLPAGQAPTPVPAPTPAVQPATQPPSAVPAPGSQPPSGGIPSPKVVLKTPLPVTAEKPTRPPVEKEKTTFPAPGVVPNPMPPAKTDEVEIKKTEKSRAVEAKKTGLREREVPSTTAAQESVRSQESTFFTNYSKAYALQQAGQLSEAAAIYKDILQEDQNNSYVLNNLGVIQQQQGDLKQAIVYYEKAHEVNPKFTQAMNNLGVVFYRLGEYDQSQMWFEKSLQTQPDNGTALQNLALVYKKKGYREEAKQIMKKAIQNDPQVPELYYNLARLEEETGNFVQAIKNYQQFLKTRGMVNDKLSQEVVRQIERLSTQPAGVK